MKFKCPNCFKKKWFIFSVIILIILLFFFLSHKKKNGEKNYTQFTLVPTTLYQTVTAPGKITAEEIAILRFQTGGKLAWVGVKKGDYVNKWQAIASLDQAQLEKSLKQSYNSYLSTRLDFDHTIKTNDDQITTRNYLNIQTSNDEDQALKLLLQKAQIGLDQSILAFEIADISRQYAHLYSPIQGIVIEATDIHPGVNISPATNQYIIVNPDSLRFSAQIEEFDIGQIEQNMSAIINLDAFPEDKIESHIAEIEFSPSINTSGNTVYTVNFPLILDPKFRLDMNGDVEIIITKKENALYVPIDAVEEIESEKYVQVLKEGKLEKVIIKTGIETDDNYELISGLNQGDTIIIP